MLKLIGVLSQIFISINEICNWIKLLFIGWFGLEDIEK